MFLQTHIKKSLKKSTISKNSANAETELCWNFRRDSVYQLHKLYKTLWPCTHKKRKAEKNIYNM